MKYQKPERAKTVVHMQAVLAEAPLPDGDGWQKVLYAVKNMSVSEVVTIAYHQSRHRQLIPVADKYVYDFQPVALRTGCWDRDGFAGWFSLTKAFGSPRHEIRFSTKNGWEVRWNWPAAAAAASADNSSASIAEQSEARAA